MMEIESRQNRLFIIRNLVLVVLLCISAFAINQLNMEGLHVSKTIIMGFVAISGVITYYERDKKHVMLWAGALSICTFFFCISAINQLKYLYSIGDIDYFYSVTARVVVVLIFVLVVMFETFKDSDVKNIGDDCKYENICNIIFLNTFFCRLLYVAYIDVNTGGNDVSDIAGTGHLGYIYTLYSTHRFPADVATGWEFPQPPLWHIFSAIWLKVNTLFFSIERAVENIQLFSLFVSIETLFIIKMIVDELIDDTKSRVLCVLTVAFFPYFILLSGNINNDCLVTMFGMILVYLTIRYYRTDSWKTLLLIAVNFGFAMMTKLSAAVFALPIAVTFIAKFVFLCKNKGIKTGVVAYVRRMAAFCIIAGSMSLWWSIRIKLLYGLPFGYFQPLPIGDLQYVGEFSVIQRLFGLGRQLDRYSLCFNNTFLEIDYNVILAFVKSSVFGQSHLVDNNGSIALVGGLLFWTMAAIYLLLIIIIILSTVRKKLHFDDVIIIMFAVVPIITHLVRALDIETAFVCNMVVRFAMVGILSMFISGCVCYGRLRENFDSKSIDIATLIKIIIEAFVSLSVIYLIMMLSI